MKVSKTGYKKNSKDKNKPSLLIPSNRITMKDVEFPVLGMDNYGNQQMMYPGQEYSFPGDYVYEKPMKNWLSKYQDAGEVIYVDDPNDPRLLDYQTRYNLWKYSQIPNTYHLDRLNLDDILSGTYDKEAIKEVYKHFSYLPTAYETDAYGPYGSRNEIRNIAVNELDAFRNNPELTERANIESAFFGAKGRDFLKKYPPSGYRGRYQYTHDPYGNVYSRRGDQFFGTDNYMIEPKTQFLEDTIDRELLKKIYPNLTDDIIDEYVRKQREMPTYYTNKWDDYPGYNWYNKTTVYSPQSHTSDSDENIIEPIDGLYPKTYNVSYHRTNEYDLNGNPIIRKTKGYLQEGVTHDIERYGRYYPIWDKPTQTFELRKPEPKLPKPDRAIIQVKHTPDSGFRKRSKAVEDKYPGMGTHEYATTVRIGTDMYPVTHTTDKPYGEFEVDGKKQYITYEKNPEGGYSPVISETEPARRKVVTPITFKSGGWLKKYQDTGEVKEESYRTPWWDPNDPTKWNKAWMSDPTRQRAQAEFTDSYVLPTVEITGELTPEQRRKKEEEEVLRKAAIPKSRYMIMPSTDASDSTYEKTLALYDQFMADNFWKSKPSSGTTRYPFESTNDTIINLTNKPMGWFGFNEIPGEQYTDILGNNYVERKSNNQGVDFGTGRPEDTAANWIERMKNPDDTFRNKTKNLKSYYHSKDIPAFYGVENKRFKVGKASDFNPNTIIVPVRNSTVPYAKVDMGTEDGLFNNESLYTYDADGNKIWNLGNKYKFLVHSPVTGQTIFLSSSHRNPKRADYMKTALEEFQKNNPGAYIISIDEGRFDTHMNDPKGLSEAAFKKWTANSYNGNSIYHDFLTGRSSYLVDPKIDMPIDNDANPNNYGYNLGILKQKYGGWLDTYDTMTPAWSKNPEGNWVVKAQKGLQYTVEPTRADSLELLNNTRNVLNYYNAKNYKKEPTIFYDGNNQGEKESNLAFIEEDHKKWSPHSSRTTPTGNRTVRLNEYYQPVDNNKFYQREYAAGILDTRAPMQLYDRRILPTAQYTYENVNQSDPMFGDMVGIFGYDPLSITPWDMLTDKQKKLRVKRFGRDGVPESYDPDRPAIPENIKPLPIKLLPLQGPEDRLIKEYDVIVPNEKYRKVYDKSPYSLKEYGPEGMFSHWAKEDERLSGIWRPIKETPSDLFVTKKVKYQKGGWLDQYQVGSSVLTNALLPAAKTITNYINPYNWGVPDYSNYKTFSEAFTAARKAGEKEFIWNGNRYNSRKDMDPIKFVNDDPRGEEINQMLRTEYPELLKYLNKGINLNSMQFKGVPENTEYHIKEDPNRASYEPSTRTINIGENHKYFSENLDDIIAETAHLKDPKLRPFHRILHYTDDELKRKSLGEDVYNTPGHMEYNTHRLYEPGIRMMAHFNLSPTDIKRIQKFLGVKEDGIFGEQTYRALRDKYKDHQEVKRWEEVSRKGFDDKQPDLIYPPTLTYLQVLNEDLPLKNMRGADYSDDYPAKGYTQINNDLIPLIYTDKALLENSAEDMNPLLLQEALVARGYKLPKSTKKDGSLDAKLGDETRAALLDYQSKNKIRPYKGNYVPKAKETKKTVFKTGGWLEQYQDGRQFNKYDIMSGVYDDMRQAAAPVSTYVQMPTPTEKEIEATIAEDKRLRKVMKETGAKSPAEARAMEQGISNLISKQASSTIGADQVKEKSVGDYATQAWDIATNPATALGYKIRGEEIPWGFSKAEGVSKNILDTPLSLINPATYINAAGRLADAAITPETYTQVIPQTIGATAMTLLGNRNSSDVLPTTWDESAWKMLGLGLDAGMLMANPFKMPRKYAIGYQSPSGGISTLGDLEYIAANNPKLLGSLETPYGKWALAKANPITETGLARFTQPVGGAGSSAIGAAAMRSAFPTSTPMRALPGSPNVPDEFMVQARAAGAQGPPAPKYFTNDEVQLQAEQVKNYVEARKAFNKKYGPQKYSFDENNPRADFELREEMFKLLYPNAKLPNFNAKEYFPQHFNYLNSLLSEPNMKSVLVGTPFAGSKVFLRELEGLNRASLENKLLKDSVKSEQPVEFMYMDDLRQEALDPDSRLNTDPRAYLQDEKALPENADELTDQEIRDLAERKHMARMIELEMKIQEKYGNNTGYTNLISTGKLPFTPEGMNSIIPTSISNKVKSMPLVKKAMKAIDDGIYKFLRTPVGGSLEAHRIGLNFGKRELTSKHGNRTLGEIFPITKSQKQKVFSENQDIRAVGERFLHDWGYDKSGNIRPDVALRIQNILGPINYIPNYRVFNDINNPLYYTPNKIVNTRNIKSSANKKLSDSDTQRIIRNRGVAAGVNFAADQKNPGSLTFENFGFYNLPFKSKLETFIHEGGHTYQQLGAKNFIGVDLNGKPMYLTGDTWIDRLVVWDPTHKYFVPNKSTKLGRRFGKAMTDPSVDPWRSSVGELHSELMTARFNLLRAYMAQGYSYDEAMDILKKGTNRQMKWMIENQNLNQFFKSTTKQKEKYKLLRLLPAALPIGLGIGAAAASDENKYQDGGAKEMPLGLPLREQNPYLVPEYNQPMANGYILPDPNRPELLNTGATEYKYTYGFDDGDVQVPSVVAGQYIGDNAFDRYMMSGEQFKPMPDPSSYSKFYNTVNELGLMKQKKGGVKSSAEGYYDYINGYSGIFANGGTKGWLDNYK